MPRPLFPNDFIHAHGFGQESQSVVSVLAQRDRAVDGSNSVDIISTETFGALDIESNTIYEVSFGPFILINGTFNGSTHDATTSRDGALAGCELYYDIGGGPIQLGNRFTFPLRKSDHLNPVVIPQIVQHFYSSENLSAKFGVGFNHRGGLSIPGGDMTNPMPAAATTSTTSETTTNASTTEVRDTNLGNYAFTAKAGRTYRVLLEGMRVGINAGTVPKIPVVRIRDGGASTPTTSSTIVAEARTSINTAGGVGQRQMHMSVPITGLSAGTHTLGAFIVDGNADAAERRAMVGTRYLYVEDITEAVAITDGIIQLAIRGTYSPVLLSVRPVGSPGNANIINITT